MKHWDILGKPHEPRDMTLSVSAVIDAEQSHACIAEDLGVSRYTVQSATSLDDLVYTMTNSEPTTYRGEEFPSISELARHLGVEHGTIKRRIENGTLDELEVQLPKPKSHNVTYRGETFKSISGLARHLGVNRNTIKRRIENGTLDELEVQLSKPKSHNVTYRGEEFSSIRGLARHLGVDHKVIKRRIENGTLDELESKK